MDKLIAQSYGKKILIVKFLKQFQADLYLFFRIMMDKQTLKNFPE